MPLDQLTSRTIQTANHLTSALHLIKYSHAAIMRSQKNTSTGEHPNQPRKLNFFNSKLAISESTTTTTTPSLHSLASQWWAEEAHEGSIVRNDENVRNIMRSAGWSFDEAVVDAEGKVTQPEGALLTNAKNAVEMLKAQGGVKSEHWV
jgi:hypothetical protein